MFSATKKSQKSSAQKSSGFGHFLEASRGELHSRRYFNTYHLFLQAGCLGAEVKILSLHSASKQSFRKVLAFVGSCRPHWQFLSCEKKGTKDSQGTSWFLDLQQKGAMPPLDTPRGTRNFRDRGERDRFAVTAGAKPPGDI